MVKGKRGRVRLRRTQCGDWDRTIKRENNKRGWGKPHLRWEPLRKATRHIKGRREEDRWHDDLIKRFRGGRGPDAERDYEKEKREHVDGHLTTFRNARAAAIGKTPLGRSSSPAKYPKRVHKSVGCKGDPERIPCFFGCFVKLGERKYGSRITKTFAKDRTCLDRRKRRRGWKERRLPTVLREPVRLSREGKGTQSN